MGVIKGSQHESNDLTVFENMAGGLFESEIMSTLEGFLNQNAGTFKIAKLGIHIFSIQTS